MKKKKIINSVFLIIIFYSVITSVRLLLQSRTLWLDEAYLAKSIFTRNIFELAASPLDFMQSAPVIYLYIIKIITHIFGSGEIALRGFSWLCYIFTLILAYAVSSKLKIKYPLIPTAVISACEILMRYSVEFKPYMCDSATVLLVILLYILYNENKLKLSAMTAIFAVLIWLSNPACFFIAAIAVFEIFKNIKSPLKSIISGLILLASFAVYFFFWLYPVIKKGDMTAYWQGQNFPIPTSVSDIRLASDMIHELILHFGYLRLAIVLFAIAGFFKNIIEKNPHTPIIYIGLAISVTASVLGMYPIEDRLWLFIYPTVIILCFDFLKNLKSLAYIAVSAVVMTSFNGAVYYTDTYKIVRRGEELSEIAEYVSEKNDFIYVYEHSVPVFLYEVDYKPKDNVMLGHGFFIDYNKDIEEITKHDLGYLVISHDIGDRTKGLFEALKKEYDVTVEMEVYETKLYKFKKRAVA